MFNSTFIVEAAVVTLRSAAGILVVLCSACNADTTAPAGQALLLRYDRPVTADDSVLARQAGAEEVTLLPLAQAAVVRTKPFANSIATLPAVADVEGLGSDANPVRSVFVTVNGLAIAADTAYLRAAGAVQVYFLSADLVGAELPLLALQGLEANTRFVTASIGKDDNVPAVRVEEGAP